MSKKNSHTKRLNKLKLQKYKGGYVIGGTHSLFEKTPTTKKVALLQLKAVRKILKRRGPKPD